MILTYCKGKRILINIWTYFDLSPFESNILYVAKLITLSVNLHVFQSIILSVVRLTFENDLLYYYTLGLLMDIQTIHWQILKKVMTRPISHIYYRYKLPSPAFLDICGEKLSTKVSLEKGIFLIVLIGPLPFLHKLSLKARVLIHLHFTKSNRAI